MLKCKHPFAHKLHVVTENDIYIIIITYYYSINLTLSFSMPSFKIEIPLSKSFSRFATRFACLHTKKLLQSLSFASATLCDNKASALCRLPCLISRPISLNFTKTWPVDLLLNVLSMNLAPSKSPVKNKIYWEKSIPIIALWWLCINNCWWH